MPPVLASDLHDSQRISGLPRKAQKCWSQSVPSSCRHLPTAREIIEPMAYPLGDRKTLSSASVAQTFSANFDGRVHHALTPTCHPGHQKIHPHLLPPPYPSFLPRIAGEMPSTFARQRGWRVLGAPSRPPSCPRTFTCLRRLHPCLQAVLPIFSPPHRGGDAEHLCEAEGVARCEGLTPLILGEAAFVFASPLRGGRFTFVNRVGGCRT